MEEEKITEWYEKYSVEIYRFAFAILGNSYSAEDVLQETFTKAMKKSSYNFENGREKAWLYKVARNCCCDILRKKKKEELVEEIKEVLQPNTSFDASGLEYLDMIAGLNRIEKEIVSLRIIGGLTHKQIAKVMRMTVSGVKKRYERAIWKLRVEYKGEDI